MVKKSERTLLIKKCDKLILEDMKRLIGHCQICGRREQLGVFHILSKRAYPRIRLHRDNLLLVGWFCCHYKWHHDFFDARDRIEPAIRKLRGKDYEERLRKLNETEPKLNVIRLKEIHNALKT